MPHTVTITVSGHPDENMNGDIVAHYPTAMENVRIEQRISRMCAPLAWEDLTPDGRATTRLIATLEHVIDTAPRGWYRERDGRPLLDLSDRDPADTDILWRVYTAWRTALTTFRDARAGGTTVITPGPRDDAPVASSASHRP
jgi:hypothetical protein